MTDVAPGAERDGVVRAPVPSGPPSVALRGIAAVCAVPGSWQSAVPIENGYGVDDEEQGAGVRICRGLREPRPEIRPAFRHLGRLPVGSTAGRRTLSRSAAARPIRRSPR